MQKFNPKKQIKHARQGKGWSARKVAEKADVSHTTIHNIERGQNASIDILRKVYQALNLDFPF